MKKEQKPESVSVDAASGKISGSSTYRQPSGSTMVVKNSGGSITVVQNTKPQYDMRANSLARMNQPAPQPMQMQQPAAAPGQAAPSVLPQSIEQQPVQQSQAPQQGFSLSGNPFQQPNQQPSQPTATGAAPTPSTDYAAPSGDLYQGFDPSQSAMSQTGEYQFPFFTSEGQKERLQNALETLDPFRMSPTLLGGSEVPVASQATTAFIWAANAAAVINAAADVWNLWQGFNAAGSLAATPAGTKILATAAPTVAKTAAKVGVPAVNSVNTANSIKLITQTAAKVGLTKPATWGGIITLSGIGVGVNGKRLTRVEASDYIKDSGDLAVKLRDVGLTDLADELAESNRDLMRGMQSIIGYIPYIGRAIESERIQDAVDRLNEINRSYEAKVKMDQEAEKNRLKEEDRKSEEEARVRQEADQAEQRRYNEAREAEQRRYNEGQESEQRAYNEQTTADTRAYQQQQLEDSRAYALGLESTATEPAQPSALKFGLLKPGGSTEFVDRDKAAQYYFKAPYAQLSPEQQALLNKLKEGK